MQKGNQPLAVTYAINYALTNSIHSIHYTGHEQIYVEDLFKESTKIRYIPKLQPTQTNRFLGNTKTLKIQELDSQSKNPISQQYRIEENPEESEYKKLNNQVSKLQSEIRSQFTSLSN